MFATGQFRNQKKNDIFHMRKRERERGRRESILQAKGHLRKTHTKVKEVKMFEFFYNHCSFQAMLDFMTFSTQRPNKSKTKRQKKKTKEISQREALKCGQRFTCPAE